MYDNLQLSTLETRVTPSALAADGHEPPSRPTASPALGALRVLCDGSGLLLCRAGAHLLAFEVRRGLFTTAEHTVDIPTTAGTYGVSRAKLRARTSHRPRR